MIFYMVEEISHPEFVSYVETLSAKAVMVMDINVLVGQGIECGEFLSSFAVQPDEDDDPVLVTVRGNYMIAPDYKLLRRIVRWKYNFAADENITPEDFREVYGPAFGEHFHAKWISLDRDILKMIAYFADDIQKGQDFIGMIMRRVFQYEKRIKVSK